jgi:serine/threonine protein kinase
VAIKVLNAKFSADTHANTNLLREAQSASVLNDPHICTIYEIGEVIGHAFIVMEFIEGRPLKELIPLEGIVASSGRTVWHKFLQQLRMLMTTTSSIVMLRPQML